jgi:hypothetical protein
VQFVHDTSVSAETVWYAFSQEYATFKTLERRYHISISTIQRRLDEYTLPVPLPTPRTMVAIIDATRIRPTWILVVRDPDEQETVYAKEIDVESTASYQIAYDHLKQKGFIITAVVTDGRFVDVEWLFPGIPIQMCHYHQEQIVMRYLTLNPKLLSSIELLALIRTLPNTDADSFSDAFKLWCTTHHNFLQEKTIDETTGAWTWTHKRVRQARDSIKQHLSILFTYLKYPELGIPNTTNSVDGSFKKVKTAIAVHSGLTHQRQIKLAFSILFSH